MPVPNARQPSLSNAYLFGGPHQLFPLRFHLVNDAVAFYVRVRVWGRVMVRSTHLAFRHHSPAVSTYQYVPSRLPPVWRRVAAPWTYARAVNEWDDGLSNNNDAFLGKHGHFRTPSPILFLEDHFLEASTYRMSRSVAPFTLPLPGACCSRMRFSAVALALPKLRRSAFKSLRNWETWSTRE